MKNNKLLISILSLFVLLLASCKDSLIHDFTEQKGKATLSFKVNGSSSRNILPDTSIDDFTDVVLTGTLNGSGTQIALGTWNSIEEMLEASLEVDAGSWSLNLSAKKGSVVFAATTTVSITAGQMATASFVLSAGNTEKGIADITLRFPEGSDVVLAIWSFEPLNSSQPMLNTIMTSQGISGVYLIDGTYTDGEGLQEIKDNAFTLKTELPAGKYLFSCRFGYQCATDFAITDNGPVGIDLLGDYYDYIVVQPGLESKLDYTIDYFELHGVTKAVSTQEGMELTIDVPRGTKDILLQRVTNFNEVMANPTEENMLKNVISFAKMLESPAVSATTMTFIDPYGYTEGQKLTYVVMYNSSSENFSGSYYMREFTTAYDGYALPGFSTYPEFARESNAEGISTKIKLVKDPVIDWKGHELAGDYMIFLSREYEAALAFEPDYMFNKNTKEISINPNKLHSGSNPLTGYSLCFEKDGWYYNCGVNISGLTGAQLPVLYGRPNAIPTDRGIDIEVYCDWQGEIAENGGEKVKLLRSTNSDSGYEPIKDYVDVFNDTFKFIDRKNLQKDVTYYYKLVGESGTVYGDFPATSSIDYGIPLTITTKPKLEVAGNTIATFTPGSVTVDDHVVLYDICYEFKQKDNNNIKLVVSKVYYKENGEWKENYLSAFLREYRENNPRPDDNYIFGPGIYYISKDLYEESLDGKEFIFEKAYIECYDTISKPDNSLIDVIEFTPEAQECPSSFVIHTDVILLSGDHSSNGITLNIRNIPQEADSISVRKQYINSYGDYELFRVNNLSSTRISLLDSYVNPNNNYYYYTVYAYKGDTSLDYATTLTQGFSTYGKGLGEIGLTVSTADNTVSLQFNLPDGTSNPVIYREGPSKAIITPASGKYAITDYFVQAGWRYSYSLSVRVNYEGDSSIIYTPCSEKKSVDFSGYTEDFYNCPEITKVPEYTWNVDEANNFTMTFTGEPEVFKDNVLPEFTVSKLDLNFKFDSRYKVTIPYTGSNTLTYKLVTSGSFIYTYELQPASYGIFTCDDYTYEGDADISHDLLYMGEDTEKYWLKELPGYIELN
ncbi:MAG: hypothetical protein K5907_08935 [Treponema sp.]|nr:hypothetical protein [Treponema sp.]